jgi:uncharacterized protein YbjT (DUF2867 family)
MPNSHSQPSAFHAHPTIAVAGASGFVGRHVVRELLSRNYHVRALVRDREKARTVLPPAEGLKLVQGDVLDERSLAGLCKEGGGAGGVEGCVNAIGIIREQTMGGSFERLHIEATRLLTEVARQVGVSRYIQISALGVSDTARTEYQRTKFEAEQVVRGSGLAWTIFRPSMIHGLGSDFLKTAKGWVSGTKQPFFFLPYFSRAVPVTDAPLAAPRRVAPRIAPVAVEDVAWAVAEALERPQTIGEVINLTGPEELSWPEMLRELRDAIPEAHHGLMPMGIPSEVAAIQARIAKALGLGRMLPFDEGMAIMGAQDSLASSDKARALLNFSPRPFRSTLKQYASKL